MLSLYISLAIGCILIAKYIRDYFNFRRRFNELPGDTDIHPLLGNFHSFPGLKEECLTWYYERVDKYKYFERLWAGPFSCILLAYHPETVKEVIRASTKPRNPGGLIASSYDMGTGWMGEGLILTNGQRWFRNRRLLTPSFHFEILKTYIEVYNSCSDILFEQMLKLSKSEQSLDLESLLNKYTQDIILRCAFSLESNCQTEKETEYAEAINELQQLWMERALNPMHFFEIIYRHSAKGKRFKQMCNVAHVHTEAIIRKRQASIDSKTVVSERKYRDFLDTLITARDDQGNGLTFEEIRNEVDTFLFAGHDTTASGIMWTLVSLAQHPHYQEQVFNEVKEVLGDRDEVTWEDLSRLQFTTQCIKESLRLHTTVPGIERVTTEDITLNGYKINSGTTVVLQFWCLHHNPHVWDEPLKYLPDRFSADNVAKMDPFQFVPFSAGSRNCIGQHFALNEMKVSVARVIKRFVLSPDQDKPILHHLKLTMKSVNGAFVFASFRG